MTCTISLKNMQKQCDMMCDVSCYMCDEGDFYVKVFLEKKNLKLRTTHISGSGFGFSQASYCILLLVKV